MRKLLLIGPNFFYFVQSIERAFCAMGWEVCKEVYDDPIHPYNLYNKIRYKFAKDKFSLRQKSRGKYAEYLKDRYLSADNAFDLVFILNGSNLNSEIVRLFSQRYKVVFWLFDSITRFPELAENLTFAHHVFCYEKSDIPQLAKKGIKADFLPQSVDTRLYFPIKDCDKQYDIVFGGDIFVSKKRQRVLAAVVNAFPEKKMLFVGQVQPWYKNPWKWLTRKHRDIFTNKSMSAQELNLLYNSSRVVLNIHNEQQTDGANPKVYEIAASGALQICDYNKYIAETFPGLILYHDEKELIEMIEQALSQDVSSHFNVEKHSTEYRMKEMLSMLNL